MNNRLTIQDLAGLLAEYTGKDKNSTERFLKEFIAVVSEGVYSDKQVKVKGFGTFKIIPVEKRESIHVNTGERFVIPEHYKFSFLPDKDLRELVNKPFSFFETTELGENVDFTDMDVESDEPEIKDTEDESIEEVIPEEEYVPQETDIVIPEVSAGPPEIIDEQIEESEHDNQSLCNTESGVGKKKSHKNRIAIISVFIVFLAIFNAGLYLNRSHFFEKDIPDLLNDTISAKPNLAAQSDSLVTATDTTGFSISRDDGLISKETPEVKPETATSDVIARVKIEPGSRLTLISLKYYGSKLFWVYLYEYNKAIINDPNNVPIGTVIEVPAPEIYGIDRRNRASIEKAAARQTEILSSKL